MGEIIKFIETFLTAPLQLLLILLVFGLGLYWFIKERPKTNEAQSKFILDALNENKKQKEEFQKERSEFFKLMDDYRVQTAQTSALYDKALENSTRAIENNTEVIKNQNIYTQLTNQTLSTLNDSVLRMESKVDKAVEGQQIIRELTHEASTILKNKD